MINHFGIGDILFTTPLLRNLKENFPGVFIGYICNRKTAPILENNPRVDRVFVYERDDFYDLYQKSRVRFIQEGRAFVRRIAEERFDCVIDLSLNSMAGFLMRLAGIKIRVGYDYKGRGFFLTRRFPLKGYEDKHVVRYHLDLLKKLGLKVEEYPMEIFPAEEDLTWARRRLEHGDLENRRPLVAVIPGGGASWGKAAGYKQWPPSCFAQLADKMIEKSDARIILMGGESDRELCREVTARMKGPVLQACGETTIHQLAAFLKQCDLAVLNDGGPLHVAAAAGTRTVSIFGPVDEKVYGPYSPAGVGHRVVTRAVPCRPCYRRFRMTDCRHISCLNTLAVDDVLAAVNESIHLKSA